jgi:hypothetical protein
MIQGQDGSSLSLDAHNALKQKFMNLQSGHNTDTESQGQAHLTSVISTHETKRRQHGEPVIIQRQVFFQGAVYIINEELYSDSEHSSVYTSEDDFEVDKTLAKRYKENNPLLSVAPTSVIPETEEQEVSSFDATTALISADKLAKKQESLDSGP